MVNLVLEINRIYHMDCFAGMSFIPDGKIDMILTDLPYGITNCPWDSLLPMDELWQQYERIIKPDGSIVLTASQPFTTTLIQSNRKLFRYCWYWRKNMSTEALHSMSASEDIADVSLCSIFVPCLPWQS